MICRWLRILGALAVAMATLLAFLIVLAILRGH